MSTPEVPAPWANVAPQKRKVTGKAYHRDPHDFFQYFLTHEQANHRISAMKATAISTRGMRVQLPKHLYRRVERTARLTKCHFSEVIVSALETSLPLNGKRSSRNTSAFHRTKPKLNTCWPSVRKRARLEGLRREFPAHGFAPSLTRGIS